MLLRRFSQHLKDQNWFAVSLDIIVVIVGIFLGMQVTEWNEKRLLTQQEVKYLRALDMDLARLNLVFQDKIQFEDTNARLGSHIYELLEQENFINNHKEIMAGMVGLSGRRTTNFNSPVYIDLISSAKLITIKDDNLRREIIDFFSSLEYYEGVLEKNSKYFIDERFAAFVGDNLTYHNPNKVIPSELKQFMDVQFYERQERLVASGVFQQQMSLPELPENAPLWQDFKRELSWRTMISVADGHYVSTILSRSENLSERINKYLASISSSNN